MKDFPVFATEYGVASLILKEIPYRQEAYVRIQDVQPGQVDGLLKECVDFCRVCGAEKIYAAGHAALAQYPLYTTVCEMRGTARVEREWVENLFPVTEETVGRWRQIYNERMRNVNNSGTLEGRDEEKILRSGGAYFVHRAGELLGIGWIEGEKLVCIASVKPGTGERVAHTLLSVIEGADVTLEVASTNQKAIRLYEKLGFVKTKELSRWYRLK